MESPSTRMSVVERSGRKPTSRTDKNKSVPCGSCVVRVWFVGSWKINLSPLIHSVFPPTASACNEFASDLLGGSSVFSSRLQKANLLLIEKTLFIHTAGPRLHVFRNIVYATMQARPDFFHSPFTPSLLFEDSVHASANLAFDLRITLRVDDLPGT